MRSRVALTVLLSTLIVPLRPSVQGQAPPSDVEIRKILVDRIEVQKQGVGLVVGIVDGTGRRVVTHGTSGSAAPLNGATVFEIGSISKVFTTLLLADAATRGEVALTDPVAKYLPASVRMPTRGGKQITLQDLATHTSALPRLPTNLSPRNFANPYADYTVDQMYAFLSGYELPRDIGERYEYSNLGVGLLGHVLTLRAGADYETLVTQRITGPLSMGSTVVTLSPALKQRLAAGHDAQRTPVPNWDIPTLAGAGALRSTADDMLTFLAAQLGLSSSRLDKAMAAALAIRRDTGNPRMQIALGWHIITSATGTEIIWHNGGTGGYRSFVGLHRQAKRGVVVLSNMSTPAGADDIGRHLLDASFPLLGK
jgi:serine-type D-Ala-D-Ala carboxypeptidase/endopeptidase